MVNGAAASDAVERARRLPKLGVGLHLVLVEGRPRLPPAEIPELVDADGRFRTNMARAGIDMFFRPGVRRQLAAEIEAQFAAFAANGLPLDHVNAHKHFHLHPTIAGLVLKIGRRYGMRAVRAPVEPRAVINAVEPGRSSFGDRVANVYARAMQSRLNRSGIASADQVFGLAWSGRMTGARMTAILNRLPPGLSEIYLHPAMHDGFAGHAPGYMYRAEFGALIDRDVMAAAEDIERGTYADFG